MRTAWRTFLASVILIGGGLTTGMPARAQSLGSRSSLGGYGATPGNSTAGIGVGGPIIPYAGNFGGFMPYRMGGRSSLSFQSRGASAMESTRTPFSLSPQTGGMSSAWGGMGGGSPARAFSPSGSQRGMGLGGVTRQVMPGAGGMGVMAPNFGYPFYQPPNFLTPSSSSGGASM